MNKKTAHITFGVGGLLVVGFSPLFINWAFRGNLDSDPRAHYVAGLGRIAGWLGRAETQANFYDRADRIERGVVVLRFNAETEEEMEALIAKAKLRCSWDRNTYIIEFEAPLEFAEHFRRELSDFQNRYKAAQKEGGGKSAKRPASK